MEKETNKPAEEKKAPKVSEPKSDGIIVALVKMFLNINFLKWGVKKNF
jgi:hypothetical protein